MIHQLIFAAPKPGMSETEFQRYWIDVHATQYASRIPQIRRYLIDTRVDSADDTTNPVWSGVAEIWFENEAEQLASLQTPEFLDGARADEPRWAAFWQTVVLDTEARIFRSPPWQAEPGDGVKLIVLAKRKEGMALEDFRRRCVEEHSKLMLEVPGLRGYVQGFTRDGAYQVGEAPLDAAFQLWFDDQRAMRRSLASTEFERAEQDLRAIVEPRYLHRMPVAENWVIGPTAR